MYDKTYKLVNMLRHALGLLTLLAILAIGASPALATLVFIQTPDQFNITNSSSSLSFDFDQASSTSNFLVWDITDISLSSNNTYGLTLIPTLGGQLVANSQSITNLLNANLLGSNANINAAGATIQELSSGVSSLTFSISLANSITEANPFSAKWRLAAGSGSTDVNFTVSAVVPEPATLGVFGLGLAGLGFMRRRKQN